MSAYLDSSLLVSLYITDAHSHSARSRMVNRPRMWLTALHRVEWAHAVAQHLFRGTLSSQEAAQFQAQLATDKKAGRWMETPMPESAYETALQLAGKFGPRFGMRTLDTLHVACALELGAREFWTFDERQAKLAKAAGLTVS